MAKSNAAKTQEPEVQANEKTELKLTKAQQAEVDKLTTVSARIRYLANEGYTRGQITKLIPNAKGGQLLYQHVRNVLITPVKTARA